MDRKSLYAAALMINAARMHAQTPSFPLPDSTNNASQRAGVGCYAQNGTGTTASTNALNCKNAAGVMYGLRIINNSGNNNAGYVRLYNLSTTPTCNNSAGFVESIPIPAAGLIWEGTIGIGYSNGIGWCITGNNASNDNSNSAAGVFVTGTYK